MPARGVGDVYAVEANAGCPKGGPAGVVVVDAQRELPVVIIHLFGPGDAVKVHGQQIAIVYLRERERKKKNRKRERQNDKVQNKY